MNKTEHGLCDMDARNIVPIIVQQMKVTFPSANVLLLEQAAMSITKKLNDTIFLRYIREEE